VPERARPPLTAAIFAVAWEEASDTLVAWLRRTIFDHLGRRGAVLGISGGVDSAVCAALCVRALGRERVLALMMPERESSAESVPLAEMVAEHLEIEARVEDVTSLLEAAGCYERRDRGVAAVIPEYGPGWRAKLVLPNVEAGPVLPLFRVAAEAPGGERVERRLTADAYLEILAATNLKQRARKVVEYTHADRLVYAVVGTPNRAEFDQGFFVKNGDGAADVKPIAHLYKCQVYALAEYLEIPEAILRRAPTTDTFSLPQSQEEFYFPLPFEAFDYCLYGVDHGYSPAEVGLAIGLPADHVERVYADIRRKRAATRYLHLPPLLLDD
jgi:NAD+ synthase